MIVDGSNKKLLSQDEISQYAKRGVVIEQICFQQDIESVVRYGKSNGEVQIVNFAIDNSKIICLFQHINDLKYFITRIEIVEKDGEVIPSNTGLISTNHPLWNIQFGKGKGYFDENLNVSVILLPFSLMHKNANCVHTGISIFSLDLSCSNFFNRIVSD